MIVRDRPAGWRVFFVIRGSVVPKIWPQIVVVASLSALVVGLQHQGWLRIAPVAPVALSTIGAALSIFAAFRNSACYDRWWEARKQLGQLVFEARGLARLALAHIAPAQNDDLPVRIALRCMAFALLTRDLLRGHPAGKDALLRLREQERTLVASSANPPNRLLDFVSIDIAAAVAERRIAPSIASHLEQRTVGLATALASLERTRGTPMPFTYTLLVHRTAYLFCMLLPFGLADSAGWWTPLLAAVVSYTFFGLDATGDELDAPFGTEGSRPLVIVPPCINKFYILDLQPENSFVRHAVEQGHTVFVVSWCNPDDSCGHLRWDDYVEQGAMKALEVAGSVCGSPQVNALGWCVGGTILASAVAVLRARGDESVASLTLLTTMLDFLDPGDLGVFIDEQSVASREAAIGGGGIYRGAELGFVFQTLRANDLIWPNVINSYLKGKSPEAFDLLYWNADGTNLPGPMYTWYLRNMYLENNLCVPDKLTVCGTPVDLGRIDMPCYVLATQEDHIVPWKSAYRTTQLLGGDTQFVLGASGHIAGVINPASKNRRSYWRGGKQGADAQRWQDESQEVPGSWWTHWMGWLADHGGKAVPAPTKPGNRQYRPIEPAPGRYVKVRAQ